MSLKIITISDGFSSEQVPSVADVISTKVLHRTLSALDVLNKSVDVSPTPAAPTQTTLTWKGVGQFYGKDFFIDGAKLKFMDPLAALIDAGDDITLTFQ